ncbi:S-adenosyl-L-methionine-dependent methyltransferase [Chaetomium strumarium]|uniref:S-adenosyl-L-methionine-dependent methyltransferase n=1 Tax=Chaetomium strumarium TaxID=1170767 RepID=A0AAJ0GY02_9PEZI|nr:S-adenosyl-L-methionine-dependent methyltransferase [Chaetomium strumarium]
MPRLPPSLFWRARREISPMAAQLLPACRDLESAANELRWIRQHVRDTRSPVPPALRVWRLVEKRGRGVPLQYVLGTQPFGHLEIRCKPGVLIPRPETEAYTLYLASLLCKEQALSTNPPPSLSILDLCTGTGCIPLLLLHSLRQCPSLSQTSLHAHGIDISPHAVRLARLNQAHNHHHLLLSPASSVSKRTTHHDSNLKLEESVEFHFTQADIFSPNLPLPPSYLSQPRRYPHAWDVLTCNPPYISACGFGRDTARGVRNHEPRLALVPPDAGPRPGGLLLAAQYGCRPEDVFYARVLEMAAVLKPRRVVLEVGGWEQARRVVGELLSRRRDVAGLYPTVEIWRDDPDAGEGMTREVVEIGGREVRVIGEGMGRVVYLYHGTKERG